MKRGLVVAAAMAWVCGCSGLSKVVKAPPQPLELTTVFVYPVALSGAEKSAARVFELSQRSLDRAVAEAGDKLAFYGPTEFKVTKPEVDNAWVASDAIPVLVKAGSRPEQGAVLRVSIERRVASSSMQTESTKGQRQGATASEETTWLVRGELLHPSSSTALIELSGQVTVDPFQVPPPEAEWDPAPQLTGLLETIVAGVARHAAGHAVSRPVSAASAVVFAATPASAQWLGAEEDGGDALQREIVLQNRARLMAPGVTELQAVALAKRPPGAAVVVGDGKLQPGDVVLTVDGAPALPHALARVRFKGAPAELEVKRATGATEPLVWP